MQISFYETDPGHIFTDVPFKYSVSSGDDTDPISSDLIIPNIVRNQIREIETKYFCRIDKNVTPREIFLIDVGNFEHRFIIPFSPRSISFWQQLVEELQNNENVRSFEVYGERIKPYFLENISFRNG